jgi:protein-tyrosine-phosphatase
MAAQVFKDVFGAEPEVSSAGLLKRHVGKRARDVYPQKEIEILRKHGIRLPPGRCRLVSKKDMTSADYVFVMENWMKGLLGERYPDQAGKVFLLRGFAEYAGDPEIHDVGIVTDPCVMIPYKQIEAAIKRVKRRKLLDEESLNHPRSRRYEHAAR